MVLNNKALWPMTMEAKALVWLLMRVIIVHSVATGVILFIDANNDVAVVSVRSDADVDVIADA